MERHKMISHYISNNAMNPEVVKNADALFDFTDEERKAASIIEASLIPLRHLMEVNSIMQAFAKDGLAMIEGVKGRDRNEH